MATSAFYFCDKFIDDLGLKVHNLNTDTIVAMLSNTTPNMATMQTTADFTELSTGGGYTAGGQDTLNTYTASAGTGACVGTDITWTSSGGGFGPFRYVYLVNTTASNKIVGVFDYAAAISPSGGETFVTDFGATMFTVPKSA